MFSPKSRPQRRRWWRRRTSRSLTGVLTASELDSVFRQERARVDRNGRCFSVMVCSVSNEAPGEALDFATFAEVARVLTSRMRTYDRIGNLDGQRLALVLPESDGQGAWMFADDVLAQLGEAGHRVDCEIFTYPLDRAQLVRQDGAPPPLNSAHTDRNKVHDNGHDSGLATGTDGPRPRPVPKESAEVAPDTEPWRLAEVRALAGPRPVMDLQQAFIEGLPAWRRAIDVVVALPLLIVFMPLFVLVASAVKVSSPGPILFAQLRAGRGGKPFRFYKFRSMYLDADRRKAELAGRNEKEGPIFKMRRDPRVTPVGRWLRKASIDELPQLWNVLVGDMTLVGPRPPTLDEVAAYERWQRERLDITGGLTCIWQVSGRSEIGFEEWVRMDLEYKRERSPWLDLKLLWRTLGAVFTGRGAY